MYDCIVIGGGHAGAEASLATARTNLKTLLITGNINMISSMPCNPSIGGPAKGIVVREIDALGGEMGRNADKAALQMKMLNSSKGPAVQSLRAQADKIDYPKFMQETMRNQKNLELLEGYVDHLILDGKTVKGVVLDDGREFLSKTVIIATGTYLRSRVLIGQKSFNQGPDNQKTTYKLSDQLIECGFKLLRLKTGTPQRIAKDSIHYEKTSIQEGDMKPRFFSFDEINYHTYPKQEPCYLTYTNLETHQIIKDNLDISGMYGGVIKGVGPRYCPSIETKIVRFQDKERHQIFLEPESIHYDEIYVQGFSTSMPEDVQEKMIRTIPGLEDCRIIKYAYQIEYDAFEPLDLKPTLETKLVKNLYFAGQINGTSGYEEAACQGLMAGINASLNVRGLPPLVLKRNEAYIGVLIDDLITKGTEEPYRLLTSRAEYRLLLRHDNADIRLRKYGHDVGLISDSKFMEFKEKLDSINKLKETFKETKISACEEINDKLKEIGSATLKEGISIIDLIKRPEVDGVFLRTIMDIPYKDSVLDEALIEIKYQGYIDKAYKQADKMLRLEEKTIPLSLDYNNVPNLALEAREKLNRVRPETIGQASRISGVNPADISVLLVYLELYKGVNNGL